MSLLSGLFYYVDNLKMCVLISSMSLIMQNNVQHMVVSTCVDRRKLARIRSRSLMLRNGNEC